ncbi:MAG: GvpL/GvpF family gas vesicle protein [Terracidiphilus sp.]
MAWYAYCIGERQSFPVLARHRKPIPMESLHGVSGNQVFVYPVCDLVVIASEHNPAEALGERSGVDHARVVADCFQHSTVLPFRFGTIFHDDESLRRSVRSNQRQFQGNIDKLRGKTEMHLKILVDDCCGHAAEKHLSTEGLSREYFSSLKESAGRQRDRQTRARAVSFQMHRLFTPLDEEVSCRLTDNGKMMLDIAHLIDRRSVERYLSKYATSSAGMREYQMQLSGPWPPYHFVHRLTSSAHSIQPRVSVQLPAAMLASVPASRMAQRTAAIA